MSRLAQQSRPNIPVKARPLAAGTSRKRAAPYLQRSTPDVKPRVRMRKSQGSSKGSSTSSSHPDPRYRRRLTRLNHGDTHPARHGRYAPSSASHAEPLRDFLRLDAAGCYGAWMDHSGIIQRTPPE